MVNSVFYYKITMIYIHCMFILLQNHNNLHTVHVYLITKSQQFTHTHVYFITKPQQFTYTLCVFHYKTTTIYIHSMCISLQLLTSADMIIEWVRHDRFSSLLPTFMLLWPEKTHKISIFLIWAKLILVTMKEFFYIYMKKYLKIA